MKKKNGNQENTDDCMLLEKKKYPVKLVEGDYDNNKITTVEDKTIMKSFLQNRK